MRRMAVSLLCIPLLIAGCTGKSSGVPNQRSEKAIQPPSNSALPAATSQLSHSAPLPERPSGPIRFVDATTASGITFHHHSGAFGKKYLPETMGSGAVSYTHLDVYKRQARGATRRRTPSALKWAMGMADGVPRAQTWDSPQAGRRPALSTWRTSFCPVRRTSCACARTSKSIGILSLIHI